MAVSSDEAHASVGSEDEDCWLSVTGVLEDIRSQMPLGCNVASSEYSQHRSMSALEIADSKLDWCIPEKCTYVQSIQLVDGGSAKHQTDGHCADTASVVCYDKAATGWTQPTATGSEQRCGFQHPSLERRLDELYTAIGGAEKWRRRVPLKTEDASALISMMDELLSLQWSLLNSNLDRYTLFTCAYALPQLRKHCRDAGIPHVTFPPFVDAILMSSYYCQQLVMFSNTTQVENGDDWAVRGVYNLNAEQPSFEEIYVSLTALIESDLSCTFPPAIEGVVDSATQQKCIGLVESRLRFALLFLKICKLMYDASVFFVDFKADDDLKEAVAEEKKPAPSKPKPSPKPKPSQMPKHSAKPHSTQSGSKKKGGSAAGGSTKAKGGKRKQKGGGKAHGKKQRSKKGKQKPKGGKSKGKSKADIVALAMASARAMQNSFVGDNYAKALSFGESPKGELWKKCVATNSNTVKVRVNVSAEENRSHRQMFADISNLCLQCRHLYRSKIRGSLMYVYRLSNEALTEAKRDCDSQSDAGDFGSVFIEDPYFNECVATVAVSGKRTQKVRRRKPLGFDVDLCNASCLPSPHLLRRHIVRPLPLAFEAWEQMLEFLRIHVCDTALGIFESLASTNGLSPLSKRSAVTKRLKAKRRGNDTVQCVLFWLRRIATVSMTRTRSVLFANAQSLLGAAAKGNPFSSSAQVYGIVVRSLLWRLLNTWVECDNWLWTGQSICKHLMRHFNAQCPFARVWEIAYERAYFGRDLSIEYSSDQRESAVFVPRVATAVLEYMRCFVVNECRRVEFLEHALDNWNVIQKEVGQMDTLATLSLVSMFDAKYYCVFEALCEVKLPPRLGFTASSTVLGEAEKERVASVLKPWFQPSLRAFTSAIFEFSVTTVVDWLRCYQFDLRLLSDYELVPALFYTEGLYQQLVRFAEMSMASATPKRDSGPLQMPSTDLLHSLLPERLTKSTKKYSAFDDLLKTPKSGDRKRGGGKLQTPAKSADVWRKELFGEFYEWHFECLPLRTEVGAVVSDEDAVDDESSDLPPLESDASDGKQTASDLLTAANGSCVERVSLLSVMDSAIAACFLLLFFVDELELFSDKKKRPTARSLKYHSYAKSRFENRFAALMRLSRDGFFPTFINHSLFESKCAKIRKSFLREGTVSLKGVCSVLSQANMGFVKAKRLLQNEVSAHLSGALFRDVAEMCYANSLACLTLLQMLKSLPSEGGIVAVESVQSAATVDIDLDKCPHFIVFNCRRFESQ